MKNKNLYLIITCILSTSALPITQASIQCALIIDAGSSGSRAHLYQYDLNKRHFGKVAELEKAAKLSPGLSTISADKASDYISELLKKVNIPNSCYSDASKVQFGIYGTAGMRLLSQDAQKAIYQAIRTTLQQQPNSKKFNIFPHGIRTISGRWEGIFAWIDNNWDNAKFRLTAHTNGILEMGGASTQITFHPTTNVHDNNITWINLGHRPISIYSASYLGLGQDQLRNQFLNHTTCFPNGYKLPNGKRSQFADYAVCQRSISPLITKVHQVQAINNLIEANKTFNALSGFSYTAKFFNLQSLSADLLKQKGKQFCATSWDQLQKTYPNNPFLYTYCINSAYFSRLLSRGYQLPSNATIIPTHTNRDGSNISWTRGTLIYLENNPSTKKHLCPHHTTQETQSTKNQSDSYIKEQLSDNQNPYKNQAEHKC
ncbi:hypothetical protein ACR9PT_01655 [Piscirickettsia salmonis]|uniref:hypothetical protein n=1 Tax=Piscirickettsia salmonis TaxID=1238 RepID=UPI003EB8ABDF